MGAPLRVRSRGGMPQAQHAGSVTAAAVATPRSRDSEPGVGGWVAGWRRRRARSPPRRRPRPASTRAGGATRALRRLPQLRRRRAPAALMPRWRCSSTARAAALGLEGAAAAVAAAGGGRWCAWRRVRRPRHSRLLATRPSETRSHSLRLAHPGFAFEMEAMGAIQAQALPLGELVALAITCARRAGALLPPHAHRRRRGVRSDYLTPPAPAEPGHTSLGHFMPPSLEQRVATAAKELEASGKGYATVEALSGAPQALPCARRSSALRRAARRGRQRGRDGTHRGGRRSQRDDVVLWLLGDERDEADAPAAWPLRRATVVLSPRRQLAAAATQLLRTHVLSAVRRGALAALREPSEHVKGHAAQYAAGKGFVRHLDATAASPRADSRLVSAIYYATPPDWTRRRRRRARVVSPGSGDADSEPVTLSPRYVSPALGGAPAAAGAESVQDSQMRN